VRPVVVAVVLTALVLGLGVYLGATLFVGPAEPPPSSDAPRPAATPAPTGPALEAAAPTRDLGTRLAALEAAVETLRAEQARAGERVQPLLAEFERLKSEGDVPQAGDVLATVPVSGAESDDGVRPLARKLGLDAARREAMATEWTKTLAEIEALEKEHAEVSRDGAVTTIKIGKYAGKASDAVRRWREWVDRSLTPQEKEAYEREHGDSRLLGVRAGDFERTVKIDETGGVIRFQESIATKDGPLQVVQGTAPAEARDLVMEPYDHLLRPTDR
jgi:hypothetical protein